MNRIGREAVVMGGSIAGLLAARALADYYEQVTLIERDTFPLKPEPRKGVPQSKQPHLLLSYGGEVLEGFFPGILEALIAQGAREGDADATLIYQEGGYLCRFRMGIRDVNQSRPLLEHIIRQCLLALPNVRAIQNCDVLGLAATTDQSRVTGVRILRRDAGRDEELLNADMVLDATGRGSRILDWLADLGYARPAEEQLRVDIVYTSRLYRRKPDHLPGLNNVIIAPTPDQQRGGFIVAEEEDRWRVTLFGYFGNSSPTDEHGFLEFSRSLPAPDIYNLIRGAEPLSDPVQHRFPANQRRHFEKLTRFPEGLLVIGDALCSFNPIYGQGMTIAALEAQALHGCLAHGVNQLASRYFEAAGRVIDNAWEIAAGSDLSIPQVEGERSLMVKFSNGYMSRLVRAAQHDPAVTEAFLEVLNLKASPASVTHPRIILRVLWANLRSRRRPTAPPA